VDLVDDDLPGSIAKQGAEIQDEKSCLTHGLWGEVHNGERNYLPYTIIQV
jgi:hypothetical protein